jgi:hypothetical protein
MPLRRPCQGWYSEPVTWGHSGTRVPKNEPSLRPSQRVGAYVIERLLGSGGSGEVYCVFDSARDRRVALKLLPRATIECRPDFVREFQREYHRLQLLRHPRIVEVYEYGSDVSGIYYTMELLAGPDLRAVLPLPWREASLILRDVALSLSIVHSRRLLHRDVAPGNVRRGRDGRAKLLDFGATVSLGIPCSVVGTPPCTPPEALEHAPLDPRCDLYSLGALGYCLLTGVHAYPASSFAQLPALWEQPLAEPSTRVPEVPKVLDRLITSLLQRDRRLRPSSATEVINHLEAIAELAPVARSEAAETSFVAPAFVGRLAEIDLLNTHVANALRGRGSVVSIEAAPGQGRSRLLSQLVVEASQREVLAVTVEAGRGSRRSFETAQALCAAILQRAPEIAALDAAKRELSALVSQLPGDAERGEAGVSGTKQRRALQNALRDAILALTDHVTLILLIDDVHICDEASAELVASLAQAAQARSLLVVVTKQTGVGVIASAALQTLAQHATRVLLRSLDSKSIEELVRSAFVDAPHAKFVSDWVENLSEGNPGKIVELLRHLVERNLVEFRDGVWVLPESIDPALLPHDVAQALRERIGLLSGFAREVAEFVCSFVRPPSLADLRALFPEAAASGALLSALDELNAADVISSDGRTFAVPRVALRETLVQGLTADQVREVHARIGASLARDLDDRYDRSVDLATAFAWSLAGYHLLLGGQAERGTRLWANGFRYALEIDYVPMWEGNDWYLNANLLALEAAEALGMSRYVIAAMRTGVVQSSIHGDPKFAEHGEKGLAELEQASGVRDYEELAHLADPQARSLAALQRVFERWQNTPESKRGVRPPEAIALLLATTFALACIYNHTLDVRKLEKLPSKLTPLVPTVPGSLTFKHIIEGIHASVTGRSQRELDLRLATLEGLESEGTKSIVNDTLRSHLRGFTLYTVATIEAVRDPAKGFARVTQMETETPFMTFGIWQVRRLAHIYACDDAEAQACAERMEITAIQQGEVTKYQLHVTGLPYLAAGCALAGDVMGVKSTLEKLEAMAQKLQAWQPFHDTARAQYYRLRGQFTQAREHAERACELAVAGDHRCYGDAQLTRLRVLLDADDAAGANAAAAVALQRARENALGPELEAQLCALHAAALSRLGSAAAARDAIETSLAIAQREAFAGLLLGDLQLMAAQIALRDRDGARFEQHAALVARHTCAHDHPIWMARYKRLLADAAAASLSFSTTRAGSASLSRHTDLRAVLMSELNRTSFARSLPERVLDVMLERSGVSSGFLFGFENDALRCLAPLDSEVPQGLVAALQGCFAAERAAVSRAALNTMTATLTSVVRADNGQLFQVAVLNHVGDDGKIHTAGALALRVNVEIPAIPRWDCILALSAVLERGPEP